MDDLRWGLDRGRPSLSVLLDLTLTSDTTVHGVLLGQVAELWLKGLILKRFHFCMSDRSIALVLSSILFRVQFFSQAI